MKLQEYFLHAKKTKKKTLFNNYSLPCQSLKRVHKNITLNVSVALLSMESQSVLGFHQKYLNLCSEAE